MKKSSLLLRRSALLQEWVYAARYFYPGGRLPLAQLLWRRFCWRLWRRLGLLQRPAILALDLAPRIEVLLPDLSQEYQLFMYRAPLLEAEFFYLPRLAKPGMTVLNIGANVGIYTLALAQLIPDGVVHAFEPASSTYRLLNANVTWNQLRGLVGSNIHCHQLAVSATLGSSTLYRYPSSLQHSLFAQQPDQPGETVQTVALDEWLAQQGINHVDLLWIDVEGAEELVLSGATRLLSNPTAPLIVCELNKKFGTPQRIWDRLAAHGYRFWHYNARQDRLVPVHNALNGEIYTHMQDIAGRGYGNVICTR